MGRRRNTTLLMLRSERQGQKSGEWVIKGDLYHSFYWIIIYMLIMKRILARIHFWILVVWVFFVFVFTAWDEQGYKRNETIREKWMSGQGWSGYRAIMCPVQMKEVCVGGISGMCYPRTDLQCWVYLICLPVILIFDLYFSLPNIFAPPVQVTQNLDKML